MKVLTQEQLKQIPNFSQSKHHLLDQLNDIVIVANRFGFLEAADYINGQIAKLERLDQQRLIVRLRKF